jgi:hypothetical protein
MDMQAMQKQNPERLFWARVRQQVKVARAAIAKGDVIDGPEFMRAKLAALNAQTKRPPRSSSRFKSES